MKNVCQIKWLGRMEYEAAWNLQKDLVLKRTANEIPDTLLLLEHPHTFTIGRDGHREHLLIDQDKLAQLNIAYHQVDRAGSVTYHGPGQLVGYPILNLKVHGYNFHQYIAVLEKMIIRALSFFKIQAFRQQGQRGIWVLPDSYRQRPSKWVKVDDQIAQIAAVGVKVDNWQISSHGFSINVDPSLEYFDLIMPCGIPGCHTTSLRHVLNKRLEIGAVVEPVIQSFCAHFELEPLIIKSPSFVIDDVALPQRNDVI